jgi:hypothetical protein
LKYYSTSIKKNINNGANILLYFLIANTFEKFFPEGGAGASGSGRHGK